MSRVLPKRFRQGHHIAYTDRSEIKEVTVLQLHQLDSEVLQHAQEKAQRFGSKASKLPTSAHRSEGDPFADTGPSGQCNSLPSDDDEITGKRADSRTSLVTLLTFVVCLPSTGFSCLEGKCLKVEGVSEGGGEIGGCCCCLDWHLNLINHARTLTRGH